jgi:hypothetical protein
MTERRVLIAAWAVLVALAACEPAAPPEQSPLAPPATAGAATVMVDVPGGMDIPPGGVVLGVDVYRTGSVGFGRSFPMREIETRPLADGRTRHVLLLGEPQTANLLLLRSEAARPGPGERTVPDVTVTPRIELCRTRPVPDEQPTIVTSEVDIASLPDELVGGPTILTTDLAVTSGRDRSKDLRGIAGGGRGFENAFPLCADA